MPRDPAGDEGALAVEAEARGAGQLHRGGLHGVLACANAEGAAISALSLRSERPGAFATRLPGAIRAMQFAA